MIIVGVDEAGIGCWAGPLVIVSVAVDDQVELPKLVRDSKTLSPDQREQLVDPLYDLAEWVVIMTAMPDFINASSGIWHVWDHLMEELLRFNRRRKPDRIVVDGNRMIPACSGVEYMTKADTKVREVSAASIVAKFVQTSAMEDLHEEYREFGFDNHHGYGTAQHQQALKAYGPTPDHRMAYGPVKRELEKLPDRGLALRQLQFGADRPEIHVLE